MKRRLTSSSKFVLCLVCLGNLLPAALLAQTDKNIVRVSYSYPYPNATYVSARTKIGIRYREAIMKSALQNSDFSVIGTLSGTHSGKVIVALDGRTVIFSPDKIFFSGEKVQVHISPLLCISGKNTLAYSFAFQISKSKILPHVFLQRESESSVISVDTHVEQPLVGTGINNTLTLPSDFPSIYITKSNEPAPGNIYLDNYRFTRNDNGTYLMILDNSGNVLFLRSMWPTYGQDFKPQPNGLLTYFDNDIGVNGTDMKYKFYGLDTNYVLVDSFEAANGYLTDQHELIFLPGGGYALLAQIDEQVDMRKYIFGADSNTTVIEGIIQEFDSAKHLIFEWHTKEHFSLADPTHVPDSTPFLDFTHCNSLENDGDTAFILSSRNLDEVTKISREDGHIIWRWGGKHNEFTFVNDSLLFSRQHAVRRLKNGNIVMFDNGMFHNTPFPFSRAVEYHLDENAKIATKVWEYHHDPEVYGEAMGYVQELPNGNRLIGWGSCDSVAMTEIKPDGSTALEIKFDPGIYSYRACKYEKIPYTYVPPQIHSSVAHAVSSEQLDLDQNFPNPFASATIINFRTGDHTPVQLILYDALGRKLKTLFDGTVDAGCYSAKCEAENLPSGAYFYKLSTPSTSLSRMMFISK